ncbi:MAG: flagellar motor protein MotB [Opitutaceae bacterium]|jgi:hypothetical protein|nr:flagellar motor protein MotB [Opitutaceae bacterium]
MKTNPPKTAAANGAALILAASGAALLLAGCASASRDTRITNARQPGPVVGNAIGVAAGAVAGNVAGAVVGVGEGFAAQSAKAFDNDRRVIRQWKTVQTSDGRTIQVPVEVEVDKNGMPLSGK